MTTPAPRTYTILSVKARETFAGTHHQAIARAKAMDAELQPAFGTEVEDEDGITIWSSEWPLLSE